MIYTGGTVGMVQGKNNLLIPAGLESMRKYLPDFENTDIFENISEMTPIDSSDMSPDYWYAIAEKIRDNYEVYSGFVILHGTDTLAYTASALSFLFENLAKPVVLTGSLHPLSAELGDAVGNITGAVKSVYSGIPEVTVFFGGKLLRGNRARKVGGLGLGFDSPNFPPLCEKNALKIPNGVFGINKPLCRGAAIITVFPGIGSSLLRSVFDVPGLKGVVLLTYGSGNAPTSTDFQSAIDYAVNEKNIAVVNVTQCMRGGVEPELYEAGLRSVISGADMTPEAALTKLMFLFGQGYDADKAKEMMTADLRGEITL